MQHSLNWLWFWNQGQSWSRGPPVKKAWSIDRSKLLHTSKPNQPECSVASNSRARHAWKKRENASYWYTYLIRVSTQWMQCTVIVSLFYNPIFWPLPYQIRNTSSGTITEVDQSRSRLVLAWVTDWEYRALRSIFWPAKVKRLTLWHFNLSVEGWNPFLNYLTILIPLRKMKYIVYSVVEWIKR